MSQIPADDAIPVARLRASKWFRHVDPALWDDLSGGIERLALTPGEVLFRQGDRGDAMYVVLAGCLQVSQRKEGGEVPLAEMRPGAPVGEIQVLTGGRRSATVRAVENSELARIPTEVFDQLVRSSPEMRREMVAVNRRRLHRSLLADVLTDLFGPLDEPALRYFEKMGEWIELRRGETLFERDSRGDSLYLLLRGRLAAVRTDEVGQERVLREMLRGECVGEMALFTGEPRTATVRAIRDSQVLGFSRARFDEITARYPQVLKAIVRILIERLSAATPLPSGLPRTAGGVKTVAVVAAGEDVLLGDFARRLTAGLSKLGTALHLPRQRLDQAFGVEVSHTGAPDDPAEMRTAAWLDEQELRFGYVVYESDEGPSGWTRRCIRQADRVLLVARADRAPDPDALDRLLAPEDRDEVARRTRLVLLHPDGRRPRETGRRLAGLGLERHHHLRRDRPADVERLARLVAGRGVGLALGGGGARGLAHIGVVRALREADIPIDVVGGTSFGALIAAQVAMGWDAETMVERNRKTFLEGKPHRDFTLPLVSLLSGRRADRLLREMFPGVDIEDLWLNYFAISANLTTARQVVHQSGAVSDALWASMAVPGMVAPALSGHDLLVDGGLLNNLPGDVVRRLWGGRVITVDVSPTTELRVERATGGLPSSWSVLWSRLNPLVERIEVPSVFEILMRASTLASVEHAALARAEADLYLKPPVDGFAMFEMTAIDRIVEIGYRHARSRLEGWNG